MLINKLQSKIKAFSIIETVVSLIITSIIVSIVFVLFNIVEQNLINIKETSSFSSDINRLNFAINKDNYENELLIENDRSFTFIHYNKNDSVSYLFHEDFIIRKKKNFIDTMHVCIKNINYKIIKSKNNKYQFSKINLEIKDSIKTYELNYYKRLFPNTLSNQTINIDGD